MKNLNRIKFCTNEKYKKQISLKYYLSRIRYTTKLIKLCKIEFHNSDKYTYIRLRGYLSFFLLGILLIVGISTILLGKGVGIGQQITYAQLNSFPNGYPESYPLPPPQGYPERHSERPSYSQVPPYFPQPPSHSQLPCQ